MTINNFEMFIKYETLLKANDSQIKKAYYKLSLTCHPDKSTEKDMEVNTRKFQCLSKIHKILSDKKSREVKNNF